MPAVSVVIRSYNEEKHIAKLLTGIRSQTLDDVEVILVDSGSTDHTVALAERGGARIVHIAKEEFSFGRALNRGCAAASGDILVFASAHVYPLRKDWLEHLVAPMADPQVALSYGRQVGNECTRFSEHQVFEAWFPAVSTRRQPHNFCNNANCAIRRQGWQERRYDEVLTGLEDLAWARLARQQGGHIAYVAEAAIAHVHEETWSRIRNRYRREAMALRQIEPSIRFGLVDFVGLTTSNIVSDLKAAARQRQLRQQWAEIALFRFNQFYGTWRGHAAPGAVDGALRERFYYPAETQPDSAAVSSNGTPSTLTANIEYKS